MLAGAFIFGMRLLIMPSSPLKTLVHCMLAAVVLMGGWVPPAVQHAHAGGDRSHTHVPHGNGHPHHHGDAGHNHDGHDHDGPGDGCRHRHGDQSHKSICEPGGNAVRQKPVSHRHFSWLGFEFTLPLRDAEDSERQERDWLPSVLAVFRLGNESAESAWLAAGGSTLLGDLTAAHAFSFGSADVICAAGLCRAPLVTGFLCDTARHDRSGVLLI
jgi:hypothetical protein